MLYIVDIATYMLLYDELALRDYSWISKHVVSLQADEVHF